MLDLTIATQNSKSLGYRWPVRNGEHVKDTGWSGGLSKSVPILIPRTYECDLIWKRGRRILKDLGMRSFLMIQVGLKSSRCAYKGKAGEVM